jgi:hypothetical protein
LKKVAPRIFVEIFIDVGMEAEVALTAIPHPINQTEIFSPIFEKRSSTGYLETKKDSTKEALDAVLTYEDQRVLTTLTSTLFSWTPLNDKKGTHQIFVFYLLME